MICFLCQGRRIIHEHGCRSPIFIDLPTQARYMCCNFIRCSNCSTGRLTKNNLMAIQRHLQDGKW